VTLLLSQLVSVLVYIPINILADFCCVDCGPQDLPRETGYTESAYHWPWILTHLYPFFYWSHLQQ